MMHKNVKTIDEYLAPLSKDKRSALEKLRKDIRSAVPKAEECIAYQVPAFRLDGKMLVAFGAAKNHCSFFPGSSPVRVHRNELKGYKTSKGTVRFPVDSPLPTTLVRKLVKTRVAEHSAEQAATKGRAKRPR